MSRWECVRARSMENVLYWLLSDRIETRDAGRTTLSPNDVVSVPPKIVRVIAPTFSWQVVYVDRDVYKFCICLRLFLTAKFRPFPLCSFSPPCPPSSLTLSVWRKKIVSVLYRHDPYRHSASSFCLFIGSLVCAAVLLLPRLTIVCSLTSASGSDGNQTFHLIFRAGEIRRAACSIFLGGKTCRLRNVISGKAI